MAENMLQPADIDIVFGIDTSGSMSEEVAEVQQNPNRFSRQIIDSGIDVRVLVLSTLQGAALLGGVTVDGPCIVPPLGSGQCPNDSNPPSYVHVDTMVASWDVLDVYVNAYPMYREHLRENSLKTFVTISDDNADSSTSPFGPLTAARDPFRGGLRRRGRQPRAPLTDRVELALLGHLQLQLVPLRAVRRRGRRSRSAGEADRRRRR